MEVDILNLILCVLPEHLKEQGSELIKISKIDEEERLREHSYKFGRGRHHSRERNSVDNEAKIRDKVEAAAIPLAIARLVMELWSPRMRRHAENLILQKGVEEGYLEEHHLKWVHVLENQEEEAKLDKGWLIDNQDKSIIKLVWDVFDIKTHYSQVFTHRSWVLKSYYRLKEFLPSLQEEIMERHDLTKYAFSQAIGYTLKWVHNTYHAIWKEACDFHLFNEPHHPQTWSKAHTPEEKRNKLQRWLSGASDSHTDCPYGLDIANLNLSTEDFAEPFLLESYIDMVGVEWERKKGMDENISTRKLAYIDDKFLVRYTKKQHQVISDLMEQIIASDESWKRVLLTERERVLMSTVPPAKQGMFVSQVEVQKWKEESRLVKLEDAGISGVSDSAIRKEVLDKSFFIMVARTVTELWDACFRERVEHLILKKAIEEKQINSNYVDWILVFEKKDNRVEPFSSRDTCLTTISDDAIIKLLWDEFQLNKHFMQVQQHRYWIKQSYLRLAHFMPELCKEVIERHDLSKLSLSQSLGYTLKWVHNINYPVWRKACDIHLNYEPHHPQLWSNKNTLEHKKNCLESWLGDRDSYGVTLSTLDLGSENMARVFLLESLVDMVAVEWERNKDQRQDLTNTELIYMEERFLTRYTHSDKTFVLQLMETIRMADHK